MTPVPNANVLLVDDQPANLLALEAMLGGLGYDLVRAHSGPEALRLLLRDDFAVVLLDVQMPGLDGFETARLIRGERAPGLAWPAPPVGAGPPPNQPPLPSRPAAATMPASPRRRVPIGKGAGRWPTSRDRPG